METSITIFTPTYNRAYILPKLYESLVNQHYDKFIWMIVDDGSTDETQELVTKFQSENKIKIEYYKQENGGKQRAMNVGFDKCKTDLFMCVDSDDHMTNDAIVNIIEKWEAEGQSKEIAGMVTLRGRSETEPLNCYFPNIKVSKHLDLYSKHGFKGDLDIIFRSELLKQYKFFVYDDENFMGETYVYNQIDDEHVFLVYNCITSVCEYLKDGYTKNVYRHLKKNPKGYRLLKQEHAIRIDRFIPKFAEMIKYCAADIMCKDGLGFKQCKLKGYYILAYIPGWLAYLIWFKRA